MMGTSVYNIGGGGGGLKYAGDLADADFIEFSNNTLSTFENVGRTDINFYVEPKDNEVIAAVIELTTDANATVHVYNFDGFMYIPLGYITNNTVSSGDDYKIEIIGNSFEVSQVNNLGNRGYIRIEDQILGVCKIGNLLWTTNNLKVSLPYSKMGPIGKPSDQENYPGYFYNIPDSTRKNYINDEVLTSGWRLPTYNDFLNMESSISGDYDSLLKIGQQPGATNSTGFTLILCGIYNFNSGVALQGNVTNLYCSNGNYSFVVGYSKNDNQLTYTSWAGNIGVSLRFCKDA